MAVLLIAWAFGIFLYVKIVMDWVFSADITIIAAVLVATCQALVILFVNGIYAVQFINYDWTRGSLSDGLRSAVVKSFLLFSVAVLLDIVCARLIIFGFSQELSNEIQNFCSSGCYFHGTIVRFGLIVAFPVAAHYAIFIWGTHRAVQRV